jgi:hypothetical protein
MALDEYTYFTLNFRLSHSNLSGEIFPLVVERYNPVVAFHFISFRIQ